MKSSESISTLYRIISVAISEKAAYEAVDAAFGNVMHDIREAGEEVTSENIDRRLEAYVNDFIEVARKTNVA
jgi:hypothetical protein